MKPRPTTLHNKIRLPVLASAGESAFLPSRPAAKITSSKMGLLASLGIHACLIAAACCITWFNIKPQRPPSESSLLQGLEFKLNSALKSPQSLTQVIPSPPQPTLEPKAFVRLSQPSAFDFPPSAPWISQPSPPQASTTRTATPYHSSPGSAVSATQIDGHAGKTEARKGPSPIRRPAPHLPVVAPKLLHAPPPHYPAAAKAAGNAGKVAVLIQVRGDGSAQSSSVYHSSGNLQLDQAAVAAARHWTFSPSPSLGPSETSAVVVQVTFTR